jgi:hypothetical protein
MRQGTLIDQGRHDDLLERCDLYRRIFSHYDEAGDRGQGTGDREVIALADD